LGQDFLGRQPILFDWQRGEVWPQPGQVVAPPVPSAVPTVAPIAPTAPAPTSTVVALPTALPTITVPAVASPQQIPGQSPPADAGPSASQRAEAAPLVADVMRLVERIPLAWGVGAVLAGMLLQLLWGIASVGYRLGRRRAVRDRDQRQ
jgi:hypothetical protein